MTTVTVTMTDQQARCVVDALDLYCRIGLGQYEELEMMLRMGLIKPAHDTDPMGIADDFRTALFAAKAIIGHPPNGSFGIGHPRLHEDFKRAYEIKKQIQKPMAEHRNPNPSFRGVNYDGRIVAYTSDPNITVTVEASE